MIIIKFVILLMLIVNCNAKKTVYTVSKVKNGMINIYIINKNIFDITYKYDAIYKNLYPMQELPIDKSLKANGSKLVAQFMSSHGKYELTNKYSWVMGNTKSMHDNRYRYRLPYKLGTTQVVTQGFNGKFSHSGNSKYAVDFGLKVGSKVFASRDGIVVAIKEDGNKNGLNKSFAKYANFITIKHEDGTYGKYVHLRKNGSEVKVGDFVKRGDFIAYSGNTGFTSGPHLHFVVFKAKDHKSRRSIPIKFISKSGVVFEPIRGKRYTAVR